MGVLCAPKFGALMRDTLRPDALPASPPWVPSRLRAGSRGLSRLVLLSACAALGLCCSRLVLLSACAALGLCWMRAALAAAAGSLGCVRVRAVSVSFRLRLCAATRYPCKPCASLSAALIVSHKMRLCWFAAGAFLSCSNASYCTRFSAPYQALRLYCCCCCCTCCTATPATSCPAL